MIGLHLAHRGRDWPDHAKVGPGLLLQAKVTTKDMKEAAEAVLKGFKDEEEP